MMLSLSSLGRTAKEGAYLYHIYSVLRAVSGSLVFGANPNHKVTLQQSVLELGCIHDEQRVQSYTAIVCVCGRTGCTCTALL